MDRREFLGLTVKCTVAASIPASLVDAVPVKPITKENDVKLFAEYVEKMNTIFIAAQYDYDFNRKRHTHYLEIDLDIDDGSTEDIANTLNKHLNTRKLSVSGDEIKELIKNII